MKKHLLLCLCLLIEMAILHAQINKGSILLGGGVNFDNSKVKNSDKKYLSVSLTPAVGIAFRQNLVGGINLIYGNTENTINTPDFESRSRQYGGSAFLRKYITLGKGFFLFGEGDLFSQYRKDSYSQISGNSETKTWSTGLSFYPGLSYAITKKFQFETGLPDLINLSYTEGKTTNASVTNEKTGGVNFDAFASSFSQIYFGFRVFLLK